MADEMRASSPTIRQRGSSGLQEGMESIGIRRQNARRAAQTIMGGDSSALPIGLGVADFVPFLGTTMGLEEGAEAAGEAYDAAKRGDYTDAAAGMAGAAAGLIPGGYSTYKTGKKMLKKLKPNETESVPKKKQPSLKEWAMAGGGVPAQYEGRAYDWHKVAKSYAAGGAVLPAALIDGNEFYEAAKANGLKTDNATLNKIVDRVNKGESVKEAAKNVAQSHADGGEIIEDPAYGKGGAVKKAVKDAVEGVVDGLKPMVDRINMHFKDVTKRVPELQEGAQKIQGDEMTRAEYEKLVKKYKPVKPYEFVPKPASRDDAINALTADKRDLYGTPSGMLRAGDPVGLRLDIPAYSDHGVWVPAVHRQAAGFGAGDRVGYESVAGVTNPTFGMSEKAALSIAAGKPKGTIATIKGNWNPMDEATAVARAQEYLDNPDWAQVGMDPERHGYFYDRRNMKPITAAEEAIQIGPLVLARKPQYGNKKDFKYADGGDVHMVKGGKVKKIVKEGLDKLLGKADKAPKGVEPIVVRTPEERAVIDKFGQKQDQEAVRKKKVEKATKDAQESAGQSPETQAAKPAKSKGPRVKVDADKYRKMAEEFGDEAVLKAVRAGEHLKPTATGYVGAPRTVTSPQGLGAMRRDMDTDFADSVEAVRLADPTRLGTWYDRAKQGIAESTEPYQLNRALEQHGVYSAGVSPESELTFALKHLNSRVAGDPKVAYRGAGMRNLDNAVAEDRPANMGFKIGEYAKKNDPRIPNIGLFGVDDFRRAQGMGYTDPQGNPWKAGVSETMHPFMDAETALQVDRANTAGTGGRTDWHGPHIQELPWVYGKGQDLYSRGLRGRYKGDELEGIKMSLQDANNTARDYFYKQAASSTAEQIPGARLGHVSQALDMTPEEKLAYSLEGRFDMPAPEAALNEFPEVGAGNRDAIYSALGYRQLPTRQAEGYYQNSLGGVETNPMTISRPLMDFPTGGSGLMAPDSRRMMDAAEQFRALMDAQEAGAYNLPNTMGGVKGKNSLVLDTRGRVDDPLADPSAGVLPTSEQLAKMNELVGEQGFGVTASNRGAVMFPFDATMNPKEASKAIRKSSKGLEEIFPSSQQKSLSTMGYVPGVGKRSPEGPLSTAPYSGEATADMLKAFSELPPTVSQNLSESEDVRKAIRAKALRDSKMGGTRGDIQETRRFFSEADWPKAVALMRQGLTPAAALAALGYNINAMAADER